MFIHIYLVQNWCLVNKIQSTGRIVEVDYSKDNSIFVVANQLSQKVIVYNASTYEILTQINSPNNQTPTSVKISKNSKWIGIGYDDKFTYIYNAKFPFNQIQVYQADDDVNEVDFSYDDAFYLVCSEDGSFEIWRTNNKSAYIQKDPDNIGQGKACRFSSNGEIAFAGDDRKLGIYNNVNYGQISLKTFTDDVLEVDFKYNSISYGTVDKDRFLKFDHSLIKYRDTNDLLTISVGRKGKYYIAGGKSDNLFIFNQSNDQLIQKFSDYTDNVNSARLSDDQQTIITGDSSGTIRIYKAKCDNQCQSGLFINGTKCSYCYNAINFCMTCDNTSFCKSCLPGYYYEGGTTCKNCNSNNRNCLQCTDVNTCLHCIDGFYLNINKCDPCSVQGCSKCDNSTFCSQCYRLDYYLTATNTCQKCSMTLPNCTKCDNQTICSQCEIGFYLHSNGTCLVCPNFCLTCLAVDKCIQCKQGYFSDSTGTCAKCTVSGCLTCNNSDSCMQCSQGTFLSSNLCDPCSNPCSSCSKSATNCTGCLTGYFYTASNNSCAICMTNCRICNESSKCLQCFNGFKIDANNLCKPCSDFYANCSECSSSNCLKCYEMFYLDNSNVCVTCISSITKCVTCSSNTSCIQCMNGFYHSGSTGNGSCTQCPSGCSQCSSGTVCLNCFDTFYLNGNNCVPCQNNCFQCLDQNTCISCNIGYYLDNVTCKICQSVLSYCTQCVDDTNCVSCYPGTFLDSSDYKCKLCSSNCLNCDEVDCFSCELGYFLEKPSTTKICTKCPSQCAECISLSNCSSCVNGYFYSSSDSKCKECSPVHQNCLLCSQSQCLQCSKGYQLNKTNNNVCSSCDNFIENCEICFWDDNNSPNPVVKCNSCKYGLTISSNKLQCLSCNLINGCIECKDSTHCTKCETGFYLKLDKTCDKCSSKCASCQDLSTCLTCRLGYIFTTATSTCDLCQTKIQGCQTCIINTSTTYNCTFCQVGYYLDVNDKKCYICNQKIKGCYLCSDQSVCTLCLDKYYLDPSNTSKCIKCVDSLVGCQLCNNATKCYSCENSYYLDTDTKCKFCSNNIPGCLYCKNKTNCQECYAGYFLTDNFTCNFCESSIQGCAYCNNQNVCVQCRTGYYLNTGDKQCYRCQNEGCEVCLQRSPTQCATCNSKYYLSSFTCVSCRSITDFCQLCTDTDCLECQVGFYLNSTFNCTKCSSQINGCSRCLNQSYCLQCMSSYFVNSSNLCQQCNSVMAGCQYCLNQTNCLACSTNFFLNSTIPTCQPCTDITGCMLCKNQSTCILCQGQYYLDTISYQCKSCRQAIQGCFSCLNQIVCIQCQSGFILDPAVSKCVGKSVQAQQSVGEEIKLITYYVNSQMLKHILYLKGMNYRKIDHDNLNITENGKTKLLVQDFTGNKIDLTIISYQFGANDYSLIFYTNNPINEKLKQKTNKMSFRRRLQTLDEGLGGLQLDLSVLINMQQSVYRQIIPAFDYQGSMTVGYSLNNPEFYNSYMQSQKYTFLYQIAGISILAIFLINYVVKIFCTVPKSKHKSGLLPHILALKACCLIIFPSFFQYISFCQGFMVIDLPWANKIIAQTFVNLSDIVIEPFGLFFTNLSLAGTYLTGISVYFILKILGSTWFFTQNETKSKDSLKSNQQYSEMDFDLKELKLKKVEQALGVNYDNDQSEQNKQILLNKNFIEFTWTVFGFSIVYYACVNIQGAFYNPLQLITVNGVFYILGMLLMIYVTIETIYSMIRNFKSINKVRVFIKGVLLSLAHFNPIYLISVCITTDVLLATLEFLVVYKRNQFTKIILLSHLLCNLSILTLILMPQRLSSLIATVAFLITCLIIQLYIHIKQYQIYKISSNEIILELQNNDSKIQNIDFQNEGNNVNTHVWDINYKNNPQKMKNKNNLVQKGAQFNQNLNNLGEFKQIQNQYQNQNYGKNKVKTQMQIDLKKNKMQKRNRNRKINTFYSMTNNSKKQQQIQDPFKVQIHPQQVKKKINLFDLQG